MRSPLSAAILALALAAGCAAGRAFQAGERAEHRQDWDRAVLEYSRALRLAPDDEKARRGLQRARLRAAERHAASGRSLAERGLVKEALEEYRLALDLDPAASEVRAAAAALARGPAPGAAAAWETAKDQARERPLAGLELGAAARQPLSLSFHGASLKETYEALGRAAGVNFVFDPALQDRAVDLDLEDVSFEQALSALGRVGGTFHRVTDSRVVSVIPDTPAKRRDHEQQVVKTFFLSNAEVKETVDLLRVVLGARRVGAVPGANAISISDTPEKVAAAERLVDVVDKARAEVVVEVEILEVNRGRLQDYGIQITSGLSGVDGVAGGIFPDPTRTLTLDDKPYAKDNLVISSLPGVIYRLLQSDSSTHLLASPRLRTSEGQTAQARFGDQVPVPVTLFTPLAQGGLAQQPVTSFEYKNVGVNIDLTPRVHHDGEVTLQLKLDISAPGPAGFQGVPTFNSRQVTTQIRLRDGETSILAGLISDSERVALTGIPGLASLPLVGRLFARNRVEVTETDIVMTLTPHVLSRARITAEDLKSFPVAVEGTPVLFEVPPLPPSPAPGRLLEPRIEPIRPPLQVPTPSPAP